MSSAGRFFSWAAALATFLFALYTFSFYFLASFFPGLWAALELFFIFLAAAGIGRKAVSLLGFADISQSQRTLIGATLGLGVLSFGIFFLALFRHLSALSTASFLALLWIAGFSEMRPILLSLKSARKILTPHSFWTLPILFSLGLVFWACLIPPHQYDSLVYHLPLAQAYVRTHRLANIPWLLYTYFPQNGETLFALALVLKSDLLAQMFMALALVLSAWWIFEIGRLEVPMNAVMLSILLLVTQTSVMLLSATTYVEPLVMLWTTASILSFLRWEEIGSASPDSREWLLLSAVFTGLALGTKYYAGITAGLLGARLWARFLFNPLERKRFAKDAALFTGIVTLVFSPWLIKNWLGSGNPFFPFFNHFFPSANAGWNKAVANGYFNALTEYRTGLSYFGNLIGLPIMLLTNSLRFGRGMDVLGGLGWEILFWSLPLSLWSARKNQFLRRLFIFSLCYLLIWFLTGVVLRFLIALAPILCFLVGASLEKLHKNLEPSGRTLLSTGLALIILVHLFLFAFINFGVFDAGKILLGLESRGQYLSRRLDYYPCARYASQHPGQNATILIVGDQRSYYVSPPAIASSIFAPSFFIAESNDSKSSKELASRLAEKGVGAILLVPREMTRLNRALGQWTPLGRYNFEDLLNKRTRTIYQGRDCSLLSLTHANSH